MPPSSRSEMIEKTCFWVLLSALAVGFFWLFSPFFSAILFALVLALIFDPLYRGLLKLFRQKRHLASFVSLFLIFLFVATPLGVIGTLITNQLLKLAHTFQIDPNFLNNLLGQGLITETIAHWKEMLGVEIDLGHWLKEMLQNSAQFLYQFSPKVVSKTANFFLTSMITLILTYFLFADGPRLYHEILDLSPLQPKHEKMLASEIRIMLRACIYGYVLTGFVQGIIAAIGFTIVGVKIALLLGVATFILSFIPFLGATSVWLPVLIYLYVQGQYWQAGFMLVYGPLVISGIDNILKPILIQGPTKIHPVLLFLAIFGGLKVWGPIGILAGPTLLAVFLATLRIYQQDFR